MPSPSRTVLKISLGVLLATLIVLTSLPLVSSAVSQTATAPVYITFIPSHYTVPPGGTVTIGATVANKGGWTFTATSCTLWYRVGGGAWHKAGSCLVPSDFPHAFAPHSIEVWFKSEKVSEHFPAGTIEWKVVANGIWNVAIPAVSNPGYFTLTVT